MQIVSNRSSPIVLASFDMKKDEQKTKNAKKKKSRQEQQKESQKKGKNH